MIEIIHTPSKQQHCGGSREQIKKPKENSKKEANPDGIKKPPTQSSNLGLNKSQQRKQSPSKVTNELPNYMKSTSRFHSSKDNLQVPPDSTTSSSKINSTKNSQNLISSKPMSVSKPVAKELLTKLSLKPVRSSMKKNSGVGLHPTMNLSRATCSSTIKIGRKPESLDLDEPDDALNMKACAYTYCSLHGQKHDASLHALKCFLSARRQSVKTQNSMKQKEYSSTRNKDDSVKKPVEDTVNDFFVEIYSKPQEGILQLQSCVDEVEIVDIVNEINGMIIGDHDETNQLQESYSVTSFEDYADKNSEISMEEIEVFDDNIENIEYDGQEEAHLETEENGNEKGKTNLSTDLQSSYLEWDEAAGPYLQSQGNSSECLDDLFGQKQGNILESGVVDCNFTPSQVNTSSKCKHAGADSKLYPETGDDGKVDDRILQSTSFDFAHGEESEQSTDGNLQSRVELPSSPEGSLEAYWDRLNVHFEDKDMKANVENVACYEPSKHETNHESQLNITRSYDIDGDISDGLEIQKEKVTKSESFISENPLTELTNRPKAKYSTTRKLPTENQENVREINPLLPRFLPLKPEPEAEKVNLKYQAVEERKTGEEWMIDYALRKNIRRMAPARKRKVALLVAAFESVIQQEQNATVP